MCTVTFIPAEDKVFFTSNRDEKHGRPDAKAPAAYDFPYGTLLFPKDGDAGGTWIAANDNGSAVVFLNGGFKPHVPNPPYRKSRGLVLLDIIQGTTSVNGFQRANLDAIEPFTAIIWDDGHLFECRWDGQRKHSLQMDPKVPHIWSSVTLYDESVISKRRKWFENWLQENPCPSQEDILHFHQFTGDGDSNNDLKMNRDGKVFTVSVTSMAITPLEASMKYMDIKNNQSAVQTLVFDKALVNR